MTIHVCGVPGRLPHATPSGLVLPKICPSIIQYIFRGYEDAGL